MTINNGLFQLSKNFSGTLLRPGDDTYEEVRQIHNGMINKRPSLIARCLTATDVAESISFAREQGLEISVRGGGHNVAGRAVCEGGLMIDLSRMKGIDVDTQRRTVRAEPGVLWGEFNRDTQRHGLATTGGAISTTGIAGLTLGGGIGYLMGKYGLSADNLISAEVVTADSNILQASANENEDLFWALRGGGGNFGVVSSFEYQLHPVGPEVTGGLIAFPIDSARELLQLYRDFTASLPDELTIFLGLVYAPDGSGTPLAAIVPCHCGDLQDGKAALTRIKEFGTPLMDQIGVITYEDINTMLDAGFPKGALSYWKSSFIEELSDAAIDVLIDQFSHCPSSMSSLFLEHFHGAATRVAPTDTAFPHRNQGYNFAVIGQWSDPKQSGANIAWVRESYAAMEPYTAAGAYVNYLGDDVGESTVQSAYGINYERLRSIKNRYDPKNLFHLNQNIPPS